MERMPRNISLCALAANSDESSVTMAAGMA